MNLPACMQAAMDVTMEYPWMVGHDKTGPVFVDLNFTHRLVWHELRTEEVMPAVLGIAGRGTRITIVDGSGRLPNGPRWGKVVRVSPELSALKRLAALGEYAVRNGGDEADMVLFLHALDELLLAVPEAEPIIRKLWAPPVWPVVATRSFRHPIEFVADMTVHAGSVRPFEFHPRVVAHVCDARPGAGGRVMCH